jgi:hypothetical protein
MSWPGRRPVIAEQCEGLIEPELQGIEGAWHAIRATNVRGEDPRLESITLKIEPGAQESAGSAQRLHQKIRGARPWSGDRGIGGHQFNVGRPQQPISSCCIAETRVVEMLARQLLAQRGDGAALPDPRALEGGFAGRNDAAPLDLLQTGDTDCSQHQHSQNRNPCCELRHALPARPDHGATAKGSTATPRIGAVSIRS